MRINIELDTADANDLEALAALVGSLRGDTPRTISGDIVREGSAFVGIVPPATHATSDELLAEEAARAAGRPTGSPSTGEASPSGDSSTRDAEGLPWDERIHSSNRQMTDKGVWRRRRGVDEVTVGKVVAELQAAAPDDVPAPPVTDIAPPPPPVAEVPNVPDAPAPTASPAAVATTAASGGTQEDYKALMARAATAMREKGVPFSTFDEHIGIVGLAKFTDLARNFELVPTFAAHLEAVGLLEPVGAA